LNPAPLQTLLDFGWLAGWLQHRQLDTDLLSALFSPFIQHPALLLQVALWAVTAGAVGFLLTRKWVAKIPARYTAVMGGLIVLGCGIFLIVGLFGQAVPELSAAAASLLLPALLVAALSPLLEYAAARKPFPQVRFRKTPLSRLPAEDTPPQPGCRDLFISYSSKDRAVVDTIRAGLENAGLRCWIAPRDIHPGEDFPTAIANAIAASRMMLLVFSANSNLSEEVSRELYLAANSRLVILPFKIEDVEPEPGKAYYLSRVQWLDGANPPTREQLDRLIEMAGAILHPSPA
jgi:hypothetical protein